VGHALHPALDDLVTAWQVGALRACRRPASGTIHQTWLVTTDAGAFVLRGYRYADRAPVVREHRIIAHARSHGVPAVAPLPLPGGETALERDGRWYALFPHAPGQQIARAELGIAESTAMGRALAELHRALADLPEVILAPRPLQVDRVATLAEIERLATLAQAGRHLHDPVALRCLSGQRAYLESLPSGMTVDLAGLVFQPIHGDYTETNLFFQNGAVSAVIDWDQAYLAHGAWEVVRTLHLALGFEPALAGPFLAAYRAAASLSWAELDQAAAAYGLMRAHDLWLYQWIYDRGDDRPRRFLTDAGYLPVAPHWEVLRQAIPSQRT
jgi:homoserine kinase type II